MFTNEIKLKILIKQKSKLIGFFELVDKNLQTLLKHQVVLIKTT